MRHIKVLGLSLVAILAMTAIAATTASADEFTAESYPVTLTGAADENPNNDAFTTTAGVVKCPTPTYRATVTGNTTTVTVEPDYSDPGCTAFGFPAAIHTNGCHFLLHIEGGTSTEIKPTLDCPAGKDITVTATSAGTNKCTVHVGAQTPGGTVTATTVGSGATREITLDINLKEIKYTHTEGTGLGKCTPGAAATGTLAAKAIVTGEEDKPQSQNPQHIGIFLSNL
jgi:hypothetical protein